MKPVVTAFFDAATNSLSYIVADRAGGHCVIIDPVRDYDPASGRLSFDSAGALVASVREQSLKVEWIVETHVHADHLTAAPWLREQLGGRIGIGAGVGEVQSHFAPVFDLQTPVDPAPFDRLFEDGDKLACGELEIEVMHTPGHTPACVTYVAGDSAFVGDTLFMPDFGSARTDFPGGDARTLYRSIRRILSLPPSTTLYMCHDYKAPGRDAFAWETTVAEQRERNIHIRDGVSEAEYVAFRETRDAELSFPRLLPAAVQVNMFGGQLPPPAENGIRYLRMPLDTL